jgi:two-component system, OmpR family, alkaline phosphatase synthesis response regulator PhoP
MASKILVVDDEADIVEMISYNLTQNDFEVLQAFNGAEAMLKAKQKPDLILVDLNMPIQDGLRTCQLLRADAAYNSTAIMMLTAMGSEENELLALDYGADDFVRKPITPTLLLSRIKNLLKRYAPVEQKDVLVYPDLRIVPSELVVEYKGDRVQMARKEFLLLYKLAQNPGQVFPREELLSDIWGLDVIVGDRTVDVHVRKVRQKLEDRYIHTLKGFGYKFEA